MPCAELGVDRSLHDAPGIECGRFDVPESVGRPSSRRLSIAVLIARATGTRRPDPIVYLHGGPGLAALDTVPRALAGQVFPRLRAERDLVFFDPRGTGRSSPAVCPEFDRVSIALDSGTLPPAARLERRLELAGACREAFAAAGADPGAYNAVAVADDAEALRRALGYERWNVLATSWGTLPGMESLRRHPASVRALLINSAFPPNSPFWAEQLSVVVEAFAAVQRRCDAIPECRDRYPDLRRLAATAIADLDRAPLRAGDRSIDGAAFTQAMWVVLVGTPTARHLPELLRRAAARDERTIAALVNGFGIGGGTFGGYSPSQALFANCHDAFMPRSAPLVARAIAAHPDLAGRTIADEQDRLCAALQPRRAPAAFFAPVESDVPTLIFAGEFDPATPALDAYQAARFLSHGTVVEVAGASHAPFGADECTRALGLAFLDRPEAAIDLSCLAGRPPVSFSTAEQFDAFLESLR